MTTLRTRLAALLGLAALALAASQSASAARDPFSSFSIRPVSGSSGYFVLSGKTGARLVGSFRIVNTGTEAGTARLYAADATTGVTSGAVYLDRAARRRGVGRWVELPLARVTLRPGEAKVVPFSVRVPRRLRAGHHLGGIVAENLELTGGEKKGSSSGLQIRVRHLSIVAVQVNLPGPHVPAMKFRGIDVGVTGGYEVLYLAFRNSGNVLIRPQLAVQVRNARGRVVVRRVQKLDTFVPETQVRYPFYLTKEPLPPGSYRLSGTLSYEKRVTRFTAAFVISPAHVKQLPKASQPEPASTESSSWRSVFPWVLVAAALVAGLLLGAVIVRLRPATAR